MDDQSFWRDEVDSVVFARASWTELVASFGLPQHNGPAYHVLLRLWTDMVGNGELAVRYLSTLGDLVGLALIVACGRLVGRERLALLAGLLWAILPAAIWYAREAKMYSLLGALAALVLCLTLHAVANRSPGRAVAAAAFAVGAAYLHFFALLLAPPAVLVAAALWLRGRRQYLATRQVALASVALAIPLILGLLLLRREYLTLNPHATGHPFVPLGELPTRVLFGITTNTASQGGFALALLVGSLLCAVAPLVRPSPGLTTGPASVATLWTFVVVPLAGFFVVSLWLPLFAERYFMVLAPALVLLFGVGILALWSRLKAAAVVTALLIGFLFVATDLRQAASRSKADYRALGAYLRANAAPEDGLLVLMPYNERSVRFYAGDGLASVEPPDLPGGVSMAAVAQQEAPRLAPFRRLWLVRAEAEQFDPDDVIATWLASRGPPAESRAWPGIRLERWQLRP